MALDNDTRGWVMTVLSGIACVFGACFICIDLVVQLFPGKQEWRVQDSDGFLGASLSLSAGVMMFSALYSMLPSAKDSLVKGGFSTKEASWILIATFLGGVFGIQFFSQIVHRFMPSHTVDCDHTHEEESTSQSTHSHGPHEYGHNDANTRRDSQTNKTDGIAVSENTPLLSSAASSEMAERREAQASVKPSLPSRLSSKVADMMGNKAQTCDADGQCYGNSDLCATDCFKNVASRGGYRRPTSLKRPDLRSSTTAPGDLISMADDRAVQEVDTTALSLSPIEISNPSKQAPQRESPHDHSHHDQHHLHEASDQDLEAGHSESIHHHHIPTNAFLAISVQTSIAIALHKLPEGFITYATNHANPSLGVAIFVAIAVHNITEGFALALPIYLASGSRLKAIVLSIFLGGLSQPIGAGIAAAWLNIAERDRGSDASDGISDGVYGGMFAVTAGIMASVGLSLFQQSFELSHSRGLCMFSAFVGMGILGMSSALTA